MWQTAYNGMIHLAMSVAYGREIQCQPRAERRYVPSRVKSRGATDHNLGEKPVAYYPGKDDSAGGINMESKAELLAAALLAKGLDPANQKEWAREYRRLSKLSRNALIEVTASYRKKKYN